MQATLDHYGIDPTRQQMMNACLIHEYADWPPVLTDPVLVQRLGIGPMFRKLDPINPQELAVISGALGGIPPEARVEFCAEYLTDRR